MSILEPMIKLDELFMCRHFGSHCVIANCNNQIWLFLSEDVLANVLIDNEIFLPLLATFLYVKCDIADKMMLWDALRAIWSTTDHGW